MDFKIGGITQCPGYLLRQVWEMNPVLLDHEDHLPAGLTLWLPVVELSNEVKEEQLWD